MSLIKDLNEATPRDDKGIIEYKEHLNKIVDEAMKKNNIAAGYKSAIIDVIRKNESALSITKMTAKMIEPAFKLVTIDQKQ